MSYQISRNSKCEMTKKGCHAEVLEVCAQGIENYALAVIRCVKAFALTLRVPQGDILHLSGI